ncbi:tripartite motif-containing protein 45-like [Ostrea edulis]|uniref:tripartite motif-containing protein 45-like n=1 Tax=Ostrea edulis TaxID=37623 RepID=UPI0024AFC611|nr:tripartite motif-containing protein 45-like [Ostrea edulis]
MASALAFAQHYIECEECEKYPAQFLCKTCPGHLCHSCKSEHERRKITQTHKIMFLSSEKWDIMELMYCSKHRNENLKGYCSPCQTPVCTQCMMETHNGHKVRNLTTAYNTIKYKLLKEKEEIETTLLPKYEELLAKENEKQADISKRAVEVQKQMEDHTENIIKRLTSIKEEKVQLLRQEKERALTSVAISKTEIEKRIQSLNETKTQISNNLGEKPGIIFFKATNGNALDKMRRYPNSIEYKLDNFYPGDIERITENIEFGNAPTFKMEGPTTIESQKLQIVKIRPLYKPPKYGSRDKVYGRKPREENFP